MLLARDAHELGLPRVEHLDLGLEFLEEHRLLIADELRGSHPVPRRARVEVGSMRVPRQTTSRSMIWAPGAMGAGMVSIDTMAWAAAARVAVVRRLPWPARGMDPVS